MKTFILLSSTFMVLSSLTSLPVLADEQAPILVTATRTAQTADESLAAVSVITRKDIQSGQYHDVLELLRTEAGISVSRNGGYGKASGVYLRGTNSSHVLVLIDGVRASSATLGEFAWSNLNPDQVERIEIVRGPRSSLYGSDAIGGVIQIFTRKSSAPFVRLGVGTEGTSKLEAGICGGQNWQYSLNAGSFKTNGFPNVVGQSDDRGYDNQHLSVNIARDMGDSGKLGISLNHAQGTSENDPSTGDSDFINRTLSLKYESALSSIWYQTLILGSALDQSESHSPTLPSTITTKRTSLSWQNDIELDSSVLSLGLDHWKDDANKDNSGIINQQISNTGVFAQLQKNIGVNDLLIGLRNDDHEVFGNKSTGNISWGRKISDKTRLTASLGTAFKAPSVNDLFWPYSSDLFFGTTYITQGNPTVLPEESATGELGLQHRLSKSNRLKANLFETHVDNLIEWKSTQTGPTTYSYQPENVSKALIRGLEIEYQHQGELFDFSGSFSLLSAKDKTTNKQLDRRPHRSLALRTTYKQPKYKAHLDLVTASARNDTNSANGRHPGYGVVNATYLRSLSKKVSFRLRVENLLDQPYVLASSFGPVDYQTARRSAFIEIEYLQ